MLKEAVATGNTIEEAQEAAALLLGADLSSDIQYEILALPQKKTFGLFGGSPAKVRAYISLTPADSVKNYLEKILLNMDVTAEITSEETEEGVLLKMSGDDSLGTLIGRRGETLDSLQYLCSLAANQSSEGYYRVTLNAGTYREKREKTLEGLARRISSSALKTGRSTTLEPMSAYERRIIHTTVQEINGVSSWSIGEGENRRVVIGVSKDSKSSRFEGKGGRPPRRDHRSRPAAPKAAPSSPDRNPVKDASSAPLYGRIDK